MGCLRAAVIGVGSMGRNHARVYREISETDLVGLADASVTCVEHVARENGTAAFADHRELLDRCSPDIVSVAVPTEDHFAVALDVLQAGCDVLVEKPITLSVEQGVQLVQTAEALGRKLMVGHIVRFDSAVLALRERLAAGELGRVFEVRCRRLGPFPSRIRDVGVVIDLATHDLDIIPFVTGQYITRVYGETERQIHSEYEDLLAGTVRLSGRTVGILDINWLTPTKIRELTVTGEKGMFHVDYLTQDLYYYENHDALPVTWDQISMLKGVSEGRMIRYPLHRQEPLRLELQAFAHSVRDDLPVPVPGEDGLAALSAALALVRSGQEHRPIDVDLWRVPSACTIA